MTEEGKKINEITATKGDKTATITYDFGGSAAAAIEKFGAEVVYANFTRSAVITAQAAMRRYLEANKTQDEVAQKMAAWKPGVPMERVVDPVAALQGLMAKMTDEEKNALIEKLMSA